MAPPHGDKSSEVKEEAAAVVSSFDNRPISTVVFIIGTTFSVCSISVIALFDFEIVLMVKFCMVNRQLCKQRRYLLLRSSSLLRTSIPCKLHLFLFEAFTHSELNRYVQIHNYKVTNFPLFVFPAPFFDMRTKYI